jgi:sarcosine oxidase subunit alpha
LTWWAAAWHLEVHISDQTARYAAVNVAGPQARNLLSRLTDVDLSNKSFPFMRWRRGIVASVPALLMRIGFVGELGYEIHVPAEYGLHFWERIMESGAEFGIAPFAVEAQRVLRLEKGHLIVGQDTDALSDPFGAGMGWAVRLDKPDFIGKPSLVRRKGSPSGEKLVGFEMRDPTLVAAEGEQFVDQERLIGRVTSARYSPTLKKSIGLGWIKSDYAAIGSTITVRSKGQFVHADIVKVPFYDPDGRQLRG